MQFLFCKQKTAYEMRISDWSSDGCSSDLADDPQHSACRKKIARDGEPVLRSRYTPFGSIIGGPAAVASSGPESDRDRGSDRCKEINELLVHLSAPPRAGTQAAAMQIANHNTAATTLTGRQNGRASGWER